MSNEPSFPVPELSQPLTFEPSVSNQASKEPNTSANNDTPGPQPGVPNDDNLRKTLLLHETCDQIEKEFLPGTKDRRQYEAYVKDYTEWWKTNKYSSIPAMPITPAKVTHFLDYLLKRPTYSSDGTEFPPNTVGRATVESAVNALEWERSNNAHRYPDEPETQTKLRSDNRIKVIEAAVRRNHPARETLFQLRKAIGHSTYIYTQTEIIETSRTCLTAETTLEAFALAIRDRALYLLPACTTFRGDSIRNLRLQDLFSRPVNYHTRGMERFIMCLRFLYAEDGQPGKAKQQGAIRHQLVDLCLVGAIALHFFVQFDLLKQSEQCNWTTDFSSGAQEAGYGTHGRREWWQYRVFPGDSGITSSMTSQSHANRIHQLHETASAVLPDKVIQTHRYTRMMVMPASGTSNEEDYRTWGNSYNSACNRKLPLGPLLDAAMYDPQIPTMHFCARDLLEPPTEVIEQIFPWVENELQALKLRIRANKRASDLALENFFQLLKDMRKILVQDLAVLYARIPESFIYSCAPFNSSAFRQFAADAPKEREMAGLRNVPRNVAQLYLALQRTLKEVMESEIEEDAPSVPLVRSRESSENPQELGEPPEKRRKLNTKASLDLSTPQANPHIVVNTAIDSTERVHPPLTAPAIAIPGSSRLPHNREETPPDGGRQLAEPVCPESAIESPVENSNITPTLQPSDTPSTSLPRFGPGSEHYPRNLWEANWLELTKRYDINQLLRHTWGWEQNHLVPHYSFPKVTTFEQLWREYTEGINGYLPFREIKERWAARPAWHRNENQKKIEYSRRKKIIDLIEKLGKLPNWTIPKALQFLAERYGGSKTLRTFMREINAEKVKEVLRESENYSDYVE